MKRWLPITLFVAVVAGHFAMRAHLSSEKEALASSGPPVRIGAEALFRAYRDDPPAAETAYKNHHLVIEGVVQEVKTSSIAPNAVLLRTSDATHVVMAHVQKALNERAAALKPGDPITLTCDGSGQRFGNPTAKNCVL